MNDIVLNTVRGLNRTPEVRESRNASAVSSTNTLRDRPDFRAVLAAKSSRSSVSADTSTRPQDEQLSSSELSQIALSLSQQLRQPLPATDTSSPMLAQLEQSDNTLSADLDESVSNAPNMLGATASGSAANGDYRPSAPAPSVELQGQQRLTQLLDRIARKGGPGLDELLAAGDSDAAIMRSAIDAIMASAGNDSGLRLAIANGDVTEPVSDIRTLVPELQGRMERVIDRMKAEYGHDVSIVETARTQERQDYLYEQGRTRPGQVVTWTRDSAHTRGQAADVIVDGKWNNPEGFARLQRIAREEGLRTLGVRDPGHLELPRNGQGSGVKSAQQLDAATLSARIERNGAGSRSSEARSRVAQVAGVASVASIATVAQSGSAVTSSVIPRAAVNDLSPRDLQTAGRGNVQSAPLTAAVISSRNASTLGSTNPLANASVDSSLSATAASAQNYRPGAANAVPPSSSPDNSAETSGKTSTTDKPTQIPGNGASISDAKSEQGAFSSQARSGSNSDGKDTRKERASIDRDKSVAVNVNGSSATTAQGTDGVKTAAAIGGADYAGRVADVQDARDATPGSVSRLTLSMDGPDGGDERITIGLRGKTVETHISTNTPAAEHMRANTGELTEALNRQGLDGDTVRITGTARNESTSATSSATADRDGQRVAASQPGTSGDAPTGEGQRDRSAGSRDQEAHGDARRAREEQERSQRQSKESYREHPEKQNNAKQ